MKRGKQMTDKEIKTSQNEVIIDGVNVAGCDFFSTRTMGYIGYNYCRLYKCVCSEPCNINCYYKQLQRKIQKCTAQEYTIQELNSEIDNFQDKLDHCREELQTKNQEYEDLKYEKDLYTTWYRAKHDDWTDVFIKNVKRNDKFKEGLKEIYNLIGKLEADCAFGDKNCDNCNHEDDTDCNFYIQKVIKQFCDKLLT